jgi:hypothetical protein
LNTSAFFKFFLGLLHFLLDIQLETDADHFPSIPRVQEATSECLFAPSTVVFPTSLEFSQLTVCSNYMCEFCSFPTSGDRDAQHSDFAGFFSAEAIDAAVLQANASRQQSQEDDEGEDDDTDGT